MRLQAVNRLVIGVGLALMLLHGGSLIVFDAWRDEQRQATQRQRVAVEQADRLLDAVRRLHAIVRAFAATGDVRHEKDYWSELRVQRTREKAETELRSMRLLPQEIALLDTARRHADRLLDVEEQAFGEGRRGKPRTEAARRPVQKRGRAGLRARPPRAPRSRRAT